MSAESVGQKLLSEVQEGDFSRVRRCQFTFTPNTRCHDYRQNSHLILVQLLSEASLGHGTTIKHCIGIDPIDDLVDLFTRTPPDTRGLSPYQDHDERPPRQTWKNARPPCLEIASVSSGQGKTHLLYHIIAKAILPPSVDGVSFKGHHSTVLYFDTDGHFSIQRMVKTVLTYVNSCITRVSTAQPRCISDDQIQALTESSLQHLHIFKPQSVASLLQALERLPNYLQDTSRHQSMHRRVYSIMLDSASAFYWADRNDTELANVPKTIEEALQRRGHKIPSMYPALRSALTNLSIRLHCPIIYTATDAQPYRPDMTVKCLPSSLPKSWHTFADVRLVINRRPIRGFPPATSAEEARRDAAERNAAVDDAPLDVIVNEDGSDEWATEIKEHLASSKTGRFTMRICSQGGEIVE